MPLEKNVTPEQNRPKGKDNYIGPLTKRETDSLGTAWHMANKCRLLDREQYWITRLKTLNPTGLNLRTEVGPPIPLVITFNDSTPIIAKMVNKVHLKLKSDHWGFGRNTMVTAFKRNRNLQDLLVSASLR